MKVFIDVSNLITVDFITGIQRVVREIVLRMLKAQNFDITLMNYNVNIKKYEVIDNQKFLDYFEYNLGTVGNLITTKVCDINDIPTNSVFFDIDSVWMSRIKRSYLLPILKKNGVKIAVQIYDIIPITHPQYCHQNTTFFFMNYLVAHLSHADIIMVSTNSTLNEINKLTANLHIERINGVVVPLGSDFKDDKLAKGDIDKKVKKIANKDKYILMVGTIEPRKNHKILLDAFDKYLINENLNIIIAGRIGWNIVDFEERLKNHEQYNKRIFHIEGANDATIDYLYKAAFFVVFPTYNEGFGLPLIESIERGTPVIASKIDVLQEIGGDYCQYFDPDNAKELADIIKTNVARLDEYKNLKDKLTNFRTFTWDRSTELMISTIESLEVKSNLEINTIKQMVILSARPNDLLNTIPFIENMMTFIKELVVCCPDKMVDVIKSNYKGKLIVKFLTDTVLLDGKPLPDDHTHRNFFLRCLAINSDIIDNTFIMSDDDYRPLVNITSDTFVYKSKYIAYYCYHIDRWLGTPSNPTSYDVSMFRTTEFLTKNNYPTLQYSSHMPQVINKSIYREMIEKHKGMEYDGYDEWSTYFNYALVNYPNYFIVKPYVAICWPGSATDWELDVKPMEFLFENFYNELYENNSLFSDFSKYYYDGIVHENVRKIAVFLNDRMQHEITRTTRSTFENMYNFIYNQFPNISLVFGNDNIIFNLPKFIVLNKTGCNKILIALSYLDDEICKKFPVFLEYFYTTTDNKNITSPSGIKIENKIKEIQLPVFGIRNSGIYKLYLRCSMNQSSEYSENYTTVLFVEHNS